MPCLTPGRTGSKAFDLLTSKLVPRMTFLEIKGFCGGIVLVRAVLYARTFKLDLVVFARVTVKNTVEWHLQLFYSISRGLREVNHTQP